MNCEASAVQTKLLSEVRTAKEPQTGFTETHIRTRTLMPTGLSEEVIIAVRCLSPWQTHKIRRCFFFAAQETTLLSPSLTPAVLLLFSLPRLSSSSTSSSTVAIYPHIAIHPPISSPSGHPPTDATPASLAACQRPVSRSVTSAHQSVNLSVRGESACSPVGRSASQSIKQTACHWGGPSARRANSQLRDVHQRSTVPPLSPDRYPGWLFPSSATEQKSRFSSSWGWFPFWGNCFHLFAWGY